jgi:uncharacterized membrane protein YfcA
METSFQLTDAAAAQLLWVALVAFAASVLGGLAGYGTGLVLPVVLAPVIGVINLIPVMALAMVFNNGSRVAAFWRDIRWPRVRRLLLLGMPACVAGAYGYTLLQARWIALLIGLFLIATVPLRRVLQRTPFRLGPGTEVLAGGVFGFINGGMTGAGLILISLLMATGVQGAALIASDAIVSLIMGLGKVVLFGSLARLDGQLAIAGVLVGLCTVPGAFVARRLLHRIPAGVHAAVMEFVVLAGGAGFLWRAFN